MKHMRNWMTFFVGAALLCSCSDQETFIEPREDAVEASFQTMISELTTRATDTRWEEDDRIGIFAFPHGEPLSEATIHDGKANVPYSNSVAGSSADFTPVSEPILFPGDGSFLDFVAYYPYTENVTDEYMLPIDVSVQSPLSAIDVLYAATTNHNKAFPAVRLVFKHQLSQIALTLTAEEGISLENAELTLKGATTSGTLDLANGTLALGELLGDITPVTLVDGTGDQLSATAILLPGQAMEDLTLQITLGEGVVYTWTPPAHILTPNTKNRYALHLKSGEVALIGTGTSIEDWGDGENKGPEELEPDFPGMENLVKVNLTRSSFEAEGGTTMLIVTALEGVEWQAATEESWLTLGDPMGDQLEVTVASNPDEVARVGKITVTAHEIPYPVTISQEGLVQEPIPGMATDLFISEYVDGSNSADKYIEIFNGTGREVDLSKYRVSFYAPNQTKVNMYFTLSGTLDNGKVIVLSHNNAALYTLADVTSEKFSFNGRTTITIEKIDEGKTYTQVDIFGRINDNVTAEGWTSENNIKTKGTTLRRKPSVKGGITVNPTSGFPTLGTEWDKFPQNTVSDLGKHTMTP